MGKYQTIPREIEAVQWHHNGMPDAPPWVLTALRKPGTPDKDPGTLMRVGFNVHCGTNHGAAVATTGDWLILSPDGEIYPCTEAEFPAAVRAGRANPGRRGGSLMNNLTFSEALNAMKAGYKVRRAGWNGKGMWVCRADGNPSLPAASFWNAHTRAFAEANGGRAEVLPYFVLKTADDKILMGWLCSQTDMDASDWEVIRDE